MENNQIIFYATPQGHVKVEVVFEEETFWLSQKRIADLFSVDVRTINEHLKNIFATGESDKNSTIRNFQIVQNEGSREVAKRGFLQVGDHYSCRLPSYFFRRNPN